MENKDQINVKFCCLIFNKNLLFQLLLGHAFWRDMTFIVMERNWCELGKKETAERGNEEKDKMKRSDEKRKLERTKKKDIDKQI